MKLYPILGLFAAGTASAASFNTIVDVYPGSTSGVGPFLIDRGPDAIFWGYSPSDSKGQPWVTDGSSAGSAMIAEIIGSSGFFDGYQKGLALNGIVYFVANNGFDGAQVWRSDGTLPGTFVLTTTPGGVGGSSLTFAAINGVVVFEGGNAGQGYVLTATDGSLAGTTTLSTTMSISSPAVTLDDMAVFEGSSGPQLGLVETDGTAAGTTFVALPQVTSFAQGAGSSAFVTVNEKVYFVASDATHGSELWSSDGTAANTALVKDIFPGATGSSPSDLTRVDDRLFFVAATSDAGRELWTSDGTAAGTLRVKDIHPGIQDSTPEQLTAFDGALYFIADTGATGKELWRSDGTDAGTTLAIGDFFAGSSGAFDYTYDTVQAINDKLALVLNPGNSGSSATPYVSDGTLSGTAPMAPGQSIALSNGMVASNGMLLAGGNIFSANEGQELVGIDAFAVLGKTWCSNPEGGVPDDNPDGFSSSIHLPSHGGLVGLRVSVDIGHTYVGDMEIALQHRQSGKSVVLFDEPADPANNGLTCSGALLDVTFDDGAATTVQDSCTDNRPAYPLRAHFKPANALAAFTGDGVGGDWTLTVIDHAQDDFGNVHQWCMSFDDDAIFVGRFE